MLTLEQQQLIASTHNVKITLSEIDKNIVMGMIENNINNFAVFVLDLNNAERNIRIRKKALTYSEFIDNIPDTTDPHNLERCIRLAIKLLEQI